MINRWNGVGRLTKEPEYRSTQNGTAVTSFTVAVNRPFKNQNGDYEADFVRCVAWRKQAENVANYVHKGDLVGIDGRIQTRSFENQSGDRVFVTEVVADQVAFLETKQSSGNDEQSGSEVGKGDPFGGPIDIDDDDLPF